MPLFKKKLPPKADKIDYSTIVPKDIWCLIFQFTNDPFSILRLGVTCKLFLAISNLDLVWLSLYDEASAKKFKEISLSEANKGQPGPNQLKQAPMSAKQFFLNSEDTLLSRFSCFAPYSFLYIQVHKRVGCNVDANYHLDKLLKLPSNLKPKQEQITQQKLMQQYAAVIYLMNQFYDFVAKKLSTLNSMARTQNVHRAAFELLQTIILTHKTSAAIVQDPAIIEIVLNFAKQVPDGLDFKLIGLVEALNDKRWLHKKDLKHDVLKVIEWMNKEENEAQLTALWRHGEAISDILLKKSFIPTENIKRNHFH
jgi:hypothetical protein